MLCWTFAQYIFIFYLFHMFNDITTCLALQRNDMGYTVKLADSSYLIQFHLLLFVLFHKPYCAKVRKYRGISAWRKNIFILFQDGFLWWCTPLNSEKLNCTKRVGYFWNTIFVCFIFKKVQMCGQVFWPTYPQSLTSTTNLIVTLSI